MKKYLKSNLIFIFGPFLFLWSLRYILPKSCLGGCGSIEGLIPFVEWTNNLIQFLRSYEIFGLFTFRDFTRGLANGVDVLLNFTEALLHKGFPGLEIGPLPWIIIFINNNYYWIIFKRLETIFAWRNLFYLFNFI